MFEGGSGLTQFRSALVAFAELALILFTALAVSAALPAPSRLRIPAFTIGGAWAICLALIYWQMLGLLPLPPSFVGGTNHYFRLIEVCEQMRSIEKAGFPKSREPDRQALIAEAVTLAAAANFVPYNPPANSTTDAWNKFIAPSQNVRGLARVIDSECGTAPSRVAT